MVFYFQNCSDREKLLKFTAEFAKSLTGPPRQPRMPRIGPCQVLAAILTLAQPVAALFEINKTIYLNSDQNNF